MAFILFIGYWQEDIVTVYKKNVNHLITILLRIYSIKTVSYPLNKTQIRPLLLTTFLAVFHNEFVSWWKLWSTYQLRIYIVVMLKWPILWRAYFCVTINIELLKEITYIIFPAVKDFRNFEQTEGILTMQFGSDAFLLHGSESPIVSPENDKLLNTLDFF